MHPEVAVREKLPGTSEYWVMPSPVQLKDEAGNRWSSGKQEEAGWAGDEFQSFLCHKEPGQLPVMAGAAPCSPSAQAPTAVPLEMAFTSPSLSGDFIS